MYESDAWLTPKQAAVLLGCSTRHMQKECEKGNIPTQKEDGKYYIQKADFFRLHPKAHKKEQDGNTAQRDIDNARREVENELLKQMLDQKDKEIEFLRNQSEVNTQEKSKMLEAITHHARLLEHKEMATDRQSSDQKRGWKYLFTKGKP